MKTAMVFWVLAAVCFAWMPLAMMYYSKTHPNGDPFSMMFFDSPWYITVGGVLYWATPAALLGAGVASAFALKSK